MINTIDIEKKTKAELIAEFEKRTALKGYTEINDYKWWFRNDQKSELIDKANFYNTYGHLDKYTGKNYRRVCEALSKAGETLAKKYNIPRTEYELEKVGLLNKVKQAEKKWVDYRESQFNGYIPEAEIETALIEFEKIVNKINTTKH